MVNVYIDCINTILGTNQVQLHDNVSYIWALPGSCTRNLN